MIIMLKIPLFIISPEGYASILWRTNKSLQAAEAMKLTAKDLLNKGD